MLLKRSTKKKLNFFYISTSFLIASFVFLSTILTNVNFNARASATLPSITSVDPISSSLEGGVKMTINGSDIQSIYTKNLFINNTLEDKLDFDIRFTLDTAKLISQSKLRDNCGGLLVYDHKFELVPVILEKDCNTDKTVFWLRTNQLSKGLNKYTLAYNISAPDLANNYNGLTHQIIKDQALIIRTSSLEYLNAINDKTSNVETNANFAGDKFKLDSKASLKINPENNLTGFHFKDSYSYLEAKLSDIDFANTTAISLWSQDKSVSSTSNLWSISDSCFGKCEDSYRHNTQISPKGLRISFQQSDSGKNSIINSNFENIDSTSFLLTQFQSQDQYLMYINNAIENPNTATAKVQTKTDNILRIDTSDPNLYLHEFLLFDKKLSTFEIQQARNYLAQTYNMTEVFSFPTVSIVEDETVSSLIAINQKYWANYISDQQVQFFSPNLDFNDYTSVDLKVYNYDVFQGEIFFQVSDIFAYTKTTFNDTLYDFEDSMISDFGCQYQGTDLSCTLKTVSNLIESATVEVVIEESVINSCEMTLQSQSQSCIISGMNTKSNYQLQLRINDRLVYQGVDITYIEPNPVPVDQTNDSNQSSSNSDSPNQSTSPTIQSSSQSPSLQSLDNSEQNEPQSPTTNLPIDLELTPTTQLAIDTQTNIIKDLDCNLNTLGLDQKLSCNFVFANTDTTSTSVNLYFFVDDKLIDSNEYTVSQEFIDSIWDGLNISDRKAQKISFNTLNSPEGATSLELINVDSSNSLIGVNEPLLPSLPSQMLLSYPILS
jgi:hypothetical protein